MKRDIDIDTSNDIFLVLNEGFNVDVDPKKYGLSFEGSPPHLVYNATNPCVLDAPGQTNMNTILHNIGYPGINITYDHMWKYVIVAHSSKFAWGVVFLSSLLLLNLPRNALNLSKHTQSNEEYKYLSITRKCMI